MFIKYTVSPAFNPVQLAWLRGLVRLARAERAPGAAHLEEVRELAVGEAPLGVEVPELRGHGLLDGAAIFPSCLRSRAKLFCAVLCVLDSRSVRSTSDFGLG